MKSIIFFVAVLALAQGQEMFSFRHGAPLPPPDARYSRPITKFITQRQDHFNTTNQNTWQMKYIENNEYFQSGGPIFVYLGGETPMGGGAFILGGQLYQMAESHNAAMYQLEHRYYGATQPTKNQNAENLKYLTVEQTLEDYAQTLIKIKQDNPTLADSKVVVFGGSYAGSLVLWMRQQYPHLVHAGVSSSGVALSKVDFHEWFDVVQENMGPECASVVTRGSEEIQRLFSVGQVAKVLKDINWCAPVDVTNRVDVEQFFYLNAMSIGGKFQESYATTAKLCKVLQNSTLATDYDRLTAYLKSPVPCKSAPVNMSSSEALNRADKRAWDYQTCTQLGFSMTSWTPTSLFGRTISTYLFELTCKYAFGPEFTPEFIRAGVAATNARYGGLNPNVTRVVSVHGSLDSWHALGLKSDESSEDLPVYVVDGSSHCADMGLLSPNDSPSMRNAKLATRRHIAAWLQQP